MKNQIQGQIIVSAVFLAVSAILLVWLIQKHIHNPNNLVYLLTFILASIATNSLIYLVKKTLLLRQGTQE